MPPPGPDGMPAEYPPKPSEAPAGHAASLRDMRLAGPGCARRFVALRPAASYLSGIPSPDEERRDGVRYFMNDNELALVTSNRTPLLEARNRQCRFIVSEDLKDAVC